MRPATRVRVSHRPAPTLPRALVSHERVATFGRSLLALVVLGASVAGQDNFKKTFSLRPYPHHLTLYDADDQPIDARAPTARPYSPEHTCKKCHDVASIAKGHHFNAALGGDAGRGGEPWLQTDRRTGTVLPLSQRGWAGTWRPATLGLDEFAFLQTFGRHQAGGSAGLTGAVPGTGRFRVAGDLAIDCLVCHAAGREYRPEIWAKEVEKGHFAWAPTLASALGVMNGTLKDLPSDFDPAAPESVGRMPTITYDPRRLGLDGTVFFDIVRRPRDEACLGCHTTIDATDSDRRWQHDGDVHARAGLSCVDCHRNGLDHHTVRGYPGESHPSGVVADLTCAGCHLDATDGRGRTTKFGGRLGAPKPEHRGLPPLHLERLACTACHSGPRPTHATQWVQTSMAHGLGIPSQTRRSTDLPWIAQPVFQKDASGRIAPHRVVWPSFWGFEADGRVTPMPLADVTQTLRRVLRVRSDLIAESAPKALSPEGRVRALGSRADRPEEQLSADERARLDAALTDEHERATLARLAQALAAFAAAEPTKTPVFVSNGHIYRRATNDELIREPHAAAAPQSWPLAHDVRPARDALGSRGCQECHSGESPFFHGSVTIRGVIPEATPRSQPQLVGMGLDPDALALWERSFDVREPFKVTVVIAVGLVAFLLPLWLLLVLAPRRRSEGSTESEEAPS